MSTHQPPDPTMTAEEVLALFPAWKDRRSVYRAARRGLFPGARRMGRAWCFPRAAVLAIAAGTPTQQVQP